jgi:Zn-dependent metallo-hydrolase RNA specificity domain
MSVDAISFSAHADFPQTSEFVAALQPPHVVLVHGEATNMQRLRDALAQQARPPSWHVHCRCNDPADSQLPDTPSCLEELFSVRFRIGAAVKFIQSRLVSEELLRLFAGKGAGAGAPVLHATRDAGRAHPPQAQAPRKGMSIMPCCSKATIHVWRLCRDE